MKNVSLMFGSPVFWGWNYHLHCIWDFVALQRKLQVSFAICCNRKIAISIFKSFICYNCQYQLHTHPKHGDVFPFISIKLWWKHLTQKNSLIFKFQVCFQCRFMMLVFHAAKDVDCHCLLYLFCIGDFQIFFVMKKNVLLKRNFSNICKKKIDSCSRCKLSA